MTFASKKAIALCFWLPLPLQTAGYKLQAGGQQAAQAIIKETRKGDWILCRQKGSRVKRKGQGSHKGEFCAEVA